MWLASILAAAAASLPSALALPPLNNTELGEASVLFSGNLEVIAEDPRFKWLESPLWSEDGLFLLWSDVKWADEDGVTCGMYDLEMGRNHLNAERIPQMFRFDWTW